MENTMFNWFRRNKHTPRSSTIITVPGETLRITLCEAKYFSEKEMAKAVDALCILSHVLNSEEFQYRVLSATFTTTKLSNDSIYKMIMVSREDIGGVADTFGMDHGDDNEVDLVVSMYSSRFSRVVGYTLPESVRIFINRKFFTWYTPAQIAGNWCHENLHNLGFDHSSASDSNSVPYLVGDIVAELGAKHAHTAIATRRPLVETVIRTGALL